MPGEDLAQLARDVPRVGNLIADAVRLRDRIAGSRAYREQWLAGCLDDRELDAALWQLTRTGLAAAATMDAVCEAADHPQLREQAVGAGYDIATAVRGLSADLARITMLADAATAIDAVLATADDHERRRHRVSSSPKGSAPRPACRAAYSHSASLGCRLPGVDRAGHIVVVELKRTTDGGHLELQAQRLPRVEQAARAMVHRSALCTTTAKRGCT